MDELQLKELIDKCLSGKASPEEQQILEDWYASFDAEQGLTEHMSNQQKADTERKILSGIHSFIDTETPEKVSLGRYFSPLRIAAGIIILGVCWFLYSVINENRREVDAVQWVEIIGEKGKVSNDTLPDGSVIWLNGAGTIRYDKNFVQAKRVVWLQGEAYFDVVPDQKHLFMVHAGNIQASVLGTEFNIKMSEPDSQVIVTVTEGRVAVENTEMQIGVLGVNEQLVYNENTDEYSRAEVKAASYITWAGRELVFKELLFRDIATIMEKKFKIKVKFANAGLQDCLLTASFGPELQPKEILSMLCKINGSELTVNKDTFTISGKPCKN